MRKTILSLVALTAIAACAPGEPFTGNKGPVEVQRALANAFTDLPFDTGAVTVLTEEHGELHSYTFNTCGNAVCSGHRRGTLQQAPDYTVITGTHAGRTFYLSPGGDGWLKLHGNLIPLAWEDPNPATVLAPTRFTEDEILNGTPG